MIGPHASPPVTGPGPTHGRPLGARRLGFGLFPRFLILMFLLVGIALCYKMGLRLYYKHFGRRRPPPPPTASSPASPTPSPASPRPDAPSIARVNVSSDLDEILKVSPDQPEKAFAIVRKALAEGADVMQMARALDHLQARLNTYDRNKVYAVLEELTAPTNELTEEFAGLFLEALVRKETYFHEVTEPLKAEENLRKLVREQHESFSPLALHILASWRFQDDTVQATRLLEEQIREYPDCPLNGQATFMIGSCFRIRDDNDKALEFYQKVLREYPEALEQNGDPLEPYVRHSLADVYIQLDRKSDAKKELDYIIEFWKGYRYKQDVQDILKSLS